MKKFYTLALAACAVLSVNAAQRQQALQTIAPALEVQKAKVELGIQLPAATRNAMKAPAATTVDEMAGTYAWSYQGLLNSNQGLNEDEVELVVTDAAKGEVTITIFKDYTVKGTIDLEAATLTIPNKQYLFDDEDGAIYFYVKGVTEEGNVAAGASDVEATVGTIEGNEITFPDFDIWALGDYDAENLGYYNLTYANKYAPMAEDPNWADYCTATFVDGWALPAFGQDPANFPWTVTVQRFTEAEGIYRIHNPYLAETCPIPSQYCGKGDIVLDLVDPDCVGVYPLFKSGFTNGQNIFYWFNVEGLYIAYDFGSEDILSYLESEGMTASTFKDNVVSIHNCVFDVDANCQNPYTWVDENDNSLEDIMVSELTFDMTGIKGVTEDNVDAPAVYYNLQGIRVANPENGVYILRKGNKATKILVK